VPQPHLDPQRSRLDTGAFDREVHALLAAARWGAADLEQVLATTARIDLADADSWLREWTAAGGEAWAAARRGSDANAYLHAASYYGAALALIGESDGLVDEEALWARQRECWEHAVVGLGGERVPIPYEATTLPGFFFRAGSEQSRRPLVIVDPGGRMVTSEAFAHVGAAARARGYHWFTFDGPGRQEAYRRQALVLRPDWEAVVGPVLEALQQRPDVDPHRIAIVGLEHGSFGVARALVTAQRPFAAAMLAPGIIDASTPWIERLPDGAREALRSEDADLFERELHLASLFTPRLQEQLRTHARWFDPDPGGTSLYNLYHRILSYRFGDGDELGRIQTPTTVCEPSGERGGWSGQADELARQIGEAATLVQAQRPDEAIISWLAGPLF
jgi:hypothetical protein